MNNLKCLSDHVSAHASTDFIDACETLCKELLKSLKIAKKFKEELNFTNLEKEELVVRLDESNKKNVYNKYYDTNNLKFLTNLFKNHYKKSTIAAGQNY